MKLPILLYHKIDDIPAGARYPQNYVTPQQFDTQLAFLKRFGYRSISFANYLAYRHGTARLPRRAVIITFDDGYRSNCDIAFPILTRHGFTATIFLVAGRVGQTSGWDTEDVPEPLLDAGAIRAMQAEGIEFQSHTTTHPRLTRLPPWAALEELCSSRVQLAELLGRPVSVVAYPYGDYNDEVMRFARDAGYEAAAIVRRRINHDTTDLFALHRIPVKYLTSLGRFAWDLLRLAWVHAA
ncbi:MAG TPA: polysaccharide deacetylase family protein [Gemmatimonadales bacterium]|nr:polysaccharide deacetylase family protein [Gemmatimonadales bacterium]